jgi:hypothetical protein
MALERYFKAGHKYFLWHQVPPFKLILPQDPVKIPGYMRPNNRELANICL